MIPTARAYGLLVLGLAIAFPLAAIGAPEPRLSLSLQCLGLFDAAVLLLMLADSWQAKARAISIRRQPLDRLSVGRQNTVHLEVQASQKAIVKLYDLHPAEIEAPELPLECQLAPKTSDTLTYTVTPAKRGQFQWGDIQVRQLGPWGLTWRNWRVPQAQAVAVYPDLMGLQELSMKLAIQATGTMRRSRRQGMGTEFAELREYNYGDDPRLIDWKATARRSTPLVRVLEPEQEQTLIVLLDRGRLMTARVQGLARFDWGLNATLALAMAALHRGDRVGIGVFDRQMHSWISPERGRERLSHIIQTLAPIQPVLLEPDYLGAVSTAIGQQSRRALVVVITDIVDATASEELLAALGRLAPRYLPFCVALRDPQVDLQAHTPSDTVEEAYARAVALDLIRQREVAFAKLRQRGGLVLDAPASSVSSQLVEQYLLLKARNRL